MEETKKILLIEDDPEDAGYLAEILSGAKNPALVIERAERLSDAINRLSEGGIDLILSDLTLPDSRGLDTFNAVAAHAGSTPILVLSGLDDEIVAIEAVRKGAQDYLVKGQLSGALLARSIRYALERHRIRRALDAASNDLMIANARLERLAHVDPLTDLLNRRGLQHVLSREIAWAQRNGSSVIVFLIDLDDFKRINDSMSHAVGDGVLKEVANRIRGPLRSTDYASRVGGDEFLVLLPATELEEGLRIAEKVRLQISQRPISVGAAAVSVTASVGVAAARDAAGSIDVLLARTHDVLYRSKRSGKNRVSHETRAHAARDASPLTALKYPSEDSGLLYALTQPIFRLEDNRVMGHEFYSRTTVPSYELPADFFRAALENNFSTTMDFNCLKTCVSAAVAFPAGERRHLNVSPLTLFELLLQDIPAFFPGCEKRGTYCLEISQHQILGDPSYLIEPIAQLKQYGFLIAVEDVTFGNGGIESMIRLEPDFMKVDRHSVNGLSVDKARCRSITRLVKMAESLNMEMIAEGVETREDFQALKTIGIKYGQGYLWGQPQPDRARAGNDNDKKAAEALT